MNETMQDAAKTYAGNNSYKDPQKYDDLRCAVIFGAQWAKQQSDDRNEFLQTENEKDQREIVQLRHDNEACERRIVELEMLLGQQSNGDKYKQALERILNGEYKATDSETALNSIDGICRDALKAK